MDRTNKKSKEKLKKEKEEKSIGQDAKTPEGIPEVNFKKFLGCG